MRHLKWLALFAGICTFAGESLGLLLMQLRSGAAGSGLKTLLINDIAAGLVCGAGAVIAILLIRLVLLRLPAGRAPACPCVRRACFLIILLSWVPCWLAYYPAIYSYDGEPQLIQYLSGAFDNHHPILHTLIMGWCYDLGRFLNTGLSIPVDGMAFYALAQMLLLAWSFACAVQTLKNVGASRRGVVLLTAWFALFPVHPLMAVSTTKDTFFTAFFILFFVRLCQLVLPAFHQQDDEHTPGAMSCTVLLLAADALGMMLMRKNGLYVMAGEWVVIAFFTVLDAIRKKHLSSASDDQKPAPQPGMPAAPAVLAAIAASVLLFLLCDQALMRITGAVQGESAEALSIPLQQIARTYKSNSDSLTPEDMEQITQYVSVTGLNNYRPFISDAVKQNFDNSAFARNPAGFLLIWAKLLARYPGSCGMAFLYHTMGAWYPGDVSHTLVYLDWWRDRTGYLITDATPVFALGYVKKENLLPGVRFLYEQIATACVHQRFWFTKVLFSPWLFLFGTVLAVFSAVTGRCRWKLVILAPLLVNYLMVLAGPCVIIRYVYPFMCILPVYCGITAAQRQCLK